MQIIFLAPKVVRNYIAQFPETSRNAYKYFNYDNRVVEERVERGNFKAPYKNADDFTNADYDALVSYARSLISPILAKYSKRVAYEDAMNIAVRSFGNGLFDGKVNANKFTVLVNAMDQAIMASKKEPPKKKEVTKPLTKTVLRQLGLETHKIPMRSQIRRRVQKGIPHLVRHPGKGVVVEK